MYPWGAPPRVSSCGPGSPRDLAPPIPFSERACKTPRALDVGHSTLFSHSGQDGGNSVVNRALLDADRDPVRIVEDVVALARQTRLPACPLQTLWVEGVAGLGENAPVGPPRGPKPGPGSPSPKNGG